MFSHRTEHPEFAFIVCFHLCRPHPHLSVRVMSRVLTARYTRPVFVPHALYFLTSAIKNPVIVAGECFSEGPHKYRSGNCLCVSDLGSVETLNSRFNS